MDYRTVTANPHRDTERAENENQSAIEHFEKDRLDKAEHHLQQALVADVRYAPAHNNLGKLYYCQGKYYLAAWEFEYTIRLMPQRPEPYNNLGLVYEAVGRLDEAISYYELARGLEPVNPEFLGNLARVRLRQGERSPEVHQLLTDLVFYDSRPTWTTWAREQLALTEFPPATPGTSQIISPPMATIEEVPLPITSSPSVVLPPWVNQDEPAEELPPASSAP